MEQACGRRRLGARRSTGLTGERPFTGRRSCHTRRVTAPMHLPTFFVRQRITMMVNRYEIRGVGPDGG